VPFQAFVKNKARVDADAGSFAVHFHPLETYDRRQKVVVQEILFILFAMKQSLDLAIEAGARRASLKFNDKTEMLR
jgi:hypothetical protein